MNELEEFLSRYIEEQDLISSLKMIHYQCRKYIDANEFKELSNFLTIFNVPSIDANVLKTILIVTAAFKNNEDIKDIRSSLNFNFEQQMFKIKSGT